MPRPKLAAADWCLIVALIIEATVAVAFATALIRGLAAPDFCRVSLLGATACSAGFLGCLALDRFF